MNSWVRKAVLVLVMVLVAAFFLYRNPGLIPSGIPGFSDESVSGSEVVDRSASLSLDEETKAQIRHYFEGVEIEANENSLDYAINLDHSVGHQQLSEGNHREAYGTYQKVLAISYNQGSLMGLGIGLGNLARIYEAFDNAHEALYTSLLAYKVFQALDNPEELGVMELAIARLLRGRDRSQAMMWLLRAKESLKDTQYRGDYIRLLCDTASDLRAYGETEKASVIYEEAWRSTQSLGDSSGEKWAKWEAGQAYASDLMRSAQYERALKILRETESFFSPSERQTENYTNVLFSFARIYSAQKKHVEARRYYLSAYTNYELTRAKAPGEDARAKLDNKNKGLVDEFVEYHLNSKDYAQALALLESNKARTLNDILEDPSYKQISSQWKEMEQRHATELMELLEQDDLLERPQENLSLEGVLPLLTKQRDERRTLQANLQLKDITVTRSLSKEQVDDIWQGLSPDVAVLSFFVRAKRVSLFLMTQRGIQHIPLPVDAAEYRRAARQLRVALTNPFNDFYREPAQMLFEKALAPALERLPAATRIIVYSPDSFFTRIPLAVLMDEEEFLGERYAVYGVTSLRYFTSMEGVKDTPAQSGISCVDPEVYNARLPFQQETAEALQLFYGAAVTTLSGSQCSEDQLVAAINGDTNPTFLHVGAHGNFYPDSAMDSTIWLSPENGNSEAHPWNARAMATVDMSHLNLITLSSCEAGLTDPTTERDVFGIARALFFSGAQSIVAPLWAVHDQATAEFMQAFYRAYARDTPAVLSLQQAQKELLSSQQYPHPFYWSAFILTGAVR